MEFKYSDEYDGSNRKVFAKICKTCKSEYWVPAHRLNTRQYCSVGCLRIVRQAKPPIEFKCAYCNKSVFRQKLSNSKSGLRFCNRACKESAQRLGGIEAIQPAHYGEVEGRKDYRERALTYYGSECQNCFYNTYQEMLDVHHIDHNRANNDLKNLEVLCIWCHGLITRNVPQHDPGPVT